MGAVVGDEFDLSMPPAGIQFNLADKASRGQDRGTLTARITSALDSDGCLGTRELRVKKVLQQRFGDFNDKKVEKRMVKACISLRTTENVPPLSLSAGG